MIGNNLVARMSAMLANMGYAPDAVHVASLLGADSDALVWPIMALSRDGAEADGRYLRYYCIDAKIVPLRELDAKSFFLLLRRLNAEGVNAMADSYDAMIEAGQKQAARAANAWHTEQLMRELPEDAQARIVAASS